MEIHILHITLAVIQFFLINLVGKHSYSIGYMSISVFAKVEEAPAFNFLLRVLAPIVFLIISAAILYSLNLDRFVVHFYTVNIYYIIFRLVFNILTGRGMLLNWYRQVLYWASIIIVSYFTYYKLINNKQNLLPDFGTIANELWIIILIFLFQVANNVRFSDKGTIKRKNQYILKSINRFEIVYGDEIKPLPNDQIKALVYSILIIENFNRPRVARWIEYMRFFITRKPHTLGIMQYYTSKYIGDHESVKLGIQKIMDKYYSELKEYKEGQKDQYYDYWSLKYELAGAYNTGTAYKADVSEMWDKILELKYPETAEELLI